MWFSGWRGSPRLAAAVTPWTPESSLTIPGPSKTYDVELYKQARQRGECGSGKKVGPRAVAADLVALHTALNWATRAVSEDFLALAQIDQLRERQHLCPTSAAFSHHFQDACVPQLP